MSIPITPVDFETNIPGMSLNNVTAEMSDLAPAPKNERVVDRNVAVEVKLTWDQVGTSPWTDFFLTLAGAAWTAKATLLSVDGGGATTKVVTIPFAGGAATQSLTIQFPPNTLAEGTYQVFLNCHLKASGGEHLATSLVAQGGAIEVFDALLVP